MRLLGSFFIALFLFSTNVFATTYTLYPDYDTKLNPASPTSNYDTSNRCQSTSWDNTACLFHFDLSGVGPSSGIIQAKIRLYADTRGGAHNYTLKRLLQTWVSNQTTWNNYSTGNAWGTAGALLAETDYTATNGTSSFAGPNNAYVTVDVTNLVKDMIDNTNNGFILRPTGSAMYLSWYTSEATGTDKDPVLWVKTGTQPETWYIRSDGSTCGIGNNCDGVTNAAYPGSGTNQACGCSTLTSAGSSMASGDTALIGNGEFSETASVPAGTSLANTTKIYGSGYETCTNESAATLYGTGYILSIGSYTDVRCLTITDHDSRGGNISDLGQGPSNRGLNITASSSGINLEDLTIYGLYQGMYGTSLGDMTLTNVKLYGNWDSGWSSGNSVNNYTGTKTWYGGKIQYSGCAVTYPLVNSADMSDPANYKYCCNQGQGCYGDGIGLSDGSSGDWTFYGTDISFNTSDGFDILHGSAGTVIAKKVRAEGNAGNQIKASGVLLSVEDSKIIGNCGFFNARSGLTATPDQDDPRVGYQPYVIQNYPTLTGTGIVITNESIGTGDGTTVNFSGTLANFPIKTSSATISYTQSGTPRTATSANFSYGYSKGKFSGTGITTDSATPPSYSYIDYNTGAYQIRFSTAPDTGTPIKFDSYTYVDGVPSGTFTGARTNFSNTTWDVVIDGNGTPDTFKWRQNDDGVAGAYTTGVAMTGSAQTLANGVSVTFKATTGHTIGDVYHFSTLGAYFSDCRAGGNPVEISNVTNSYLTNNTIYSNGGKAVEMINNSCPTTRHVYMRNNIVVGAYDFLDDTSINPAGANTKGRLTLVWDNTGNTECANAHTIIDSDYDTMCGGDSGHLTDCTSEGANNTCYTDCSSINFTTTPPLGLYPAYYSGTAMDVSLSSSLNNADTTVAVADVYDYNYANRGASWERGALDPGATAPTCSDTTQNGYETGVDCGGLCTATCAGGATCNDGIQNGDETGVDCGGSCSACVSCSDGIQNGDETGVDCGGSCTACPTVTGSYCYDISFSGSIKFQ